MRLNCTGSWTDYTSSIVVDSLKLTKQLDPSEDPTKSQTSTIQVFGDAYTFVMTNLYTGADRYSNSICVRLTHTDCSSKQYEFKIDNRDIRWCDNSVCVLDCDLTEYNPLLDCIYRETIADNTSGEYQDYPSSGTPHPRFRYCDTIKPTFLFGFVITLSNAIALLIVSLNVVIASITGIIVWIVNLLGGSWNVPQISYTFAETLIGCDRGFPAPFVRSYISNVCALCSVYVDDSTAPVLYGINIPLEDGSSTIIENPYYQLCLLTAYAKKGVAMVGGKDYIPNNQPSWTLYHLLSVLKPFFNARWAINAGVLYFERKDKIGELIWGSAPALDLSSSTDADRLISDVCYKWNGKGKPKRINYTYAIDSGDNIGNELRNRFNGEYLNTSSNLNYNDSVEVNNFEFSAPACVLDGQDSAYDANIDKALGGILLGHDYTGCLKTQGDTLGNAKLLIYDPLTDMDDARVAGNSYDIYGSVGEDIDSFKDDDANFFPISSGDCYNFNYPMSFDPDANNIAGNGFSNLWRFHYIDANNSSNLTNVGFEFTLRFCCTYNSLDLYQKVLFRDGVTYGEITFIEIDFGKMEILVKGNMLN